MFCPNCGNKLNGNEEFCANCGNKMSEVKEPIMKKIGNNIIKFKKIYLIVIGIVLIFFIGLALFNTFFGFDKLSWNEKYTDVNLEYVAPTKIKLGVNFKNEEKIDKLKYDVTCGELKKNGLEVEWDLTGATGKCKITASYKLRKISKEFTIIKADTNEALYLDYEIDYDSDEDLDLDGLTNKQEKEYKTNVLLSDTDMDGLNDYYEI